MIGQGYGPREGLLRQRGGGDEEGDQHREEEDGVDHLAAPDVGDEGREEGHRGV